ncbi:MAG: hypothetical protein V1875_09325 [Candidatus Altiarchaeota archaeon]
MVNRIEGLNPPASTEGISLFQITKNVEPIERNDLPGVTEYRVSEGLDYLGKVLVFAPGLATIGCQSFSDLPIPIPQMVGESSLRIISRLSQLRFQEGYVFRELFNSETFEPYYLTPGVGASLKEFGAPAHIRFIGDPSSFRRHLTVWKSPDGVSKALINKIPGENESHSNVEETNFTTAVHLYNHYLQHGITPPMAAPVAFVDIPSSVHARYKDVMFYRIRRPDDFSPKYMVLQHLDGKRIITNGQQLSDSNTVIDSEYVRKVAQKNGLNPNDIVGDMFSEPFRILANIHEAGHYMRIDGHFGNFMLCTDGVVRFLSDLGASTQRTDVKWNIVRDLRFMEDSMSNVQRNMCSDDNRSGWEGLIKEMKRLINDVSDGKGSYRI